MAEGQAAVAQVGALSHLAIRVTDLDRSVAFYRDLLGYEVIDDHREDARAPRVLGRVAGVALELLKSAPGGRSEPGAVGLAGLSFSVRNLDEVCRVLHARGLIKRAEPKVFGKARLIFVPDPDGSFFELIEYPREAETLLEFYGARGQHSAA